MLVDFQYFNKKLIVSYIDKDGKLKIKHYNFNPTKFIECSEEDPERIHELHTWDNKPVASVDVKFANRYSALYFLDSLPDEEKELIFGYSNPNVYYMDIETEIVDGFPDQHSAKTRVLANSIVHNNAGLMMGIKPLSDEAVIRIEKKVNEYFKKFDANFKVKYIEYKDETEMLHSLFSKYIPTMPVITGWNFVEYDWVYLVNRCRKVGVNPNLSSPTGQLEAQWDSKTRSNTGVELPAHRVIVDYMDLFAKYDTKIKIKETNKLDFVAEKILGLKKIEYEGSLQELYENDYEKYMYYNIVDVILVKYLHDICKYLDIMFAISSMANVKITDVFSSVRTTEGVLRRDFREQGIVFVKDRKLETTGINTYTEADEIKAEDIFQHKTISSFDESEISNTSDNIFEMFDNEDSYDEALEVKDGEISIKGGWVKHPVKGMVPWVVVFDFASLYPTCMRQFNIASESYKGITKDRITCNFNGVISNVEPDDIVLLNGTVFKNDYSVSKKKIETIFKDRKMYKNKMFEARDQRIELEKQLAALL